MGELAKIPQIEYELKIKNGPEAGSSYKLMAGEIRIGRSSDNDISLSYDLKCSRHHVMVRITPQGVSVENISENNKLFVENQEVKTSSLESGQSFKLGDTEIQFSLNLPASMTGSSASHESQRHLSLAGPTPQSTQVYNPHANNPHHASPFVGSNPEFAKMKPAPSSKTRFYIIVGLVFALFAWLLLSEGPEKEKEVEIRTEQQMQADIEASQALLQADEEDWATSGTDSDQYRQAQSNFVKGFRDYKQGQFERAMESFQACLSLFPKHTLCQRYIKLSQKRLNELIQYQMILGRKYMEQSQHQACSAAFRNVMVLVKDVNSPIYKEASINFKLCATRLKRRF